MPRRSSSQSHRLVELFKEAEQGKKPTPEAKSEPPQDEPSCISSQEEEAGFDYQRWQRQCWATRLAVPRGSIQKPVGKRAAEKIDQYLQQGNMEAALKIRGQGRMNQAPSPTIRSPYNEDLYRHLLIG